MYMRECTMKKKNINIVHCAHMNYNMHCIWTHTLTGQIQCRIQFNNEKYVKYCVLKNFKNFQLKSLYNYLFKQDVNTLESCCEMCGYLLNFKQKISLWMF